MRQHDQQFFDTFMLVIGILAGVAVGLFFLVRAISIDTQGLYIIDDFQYADMASLDVLDDLLPRLEQLPCLVVLTFRPEPQAAAWRVHRQLAERQAGRYVTVELAPLDEQQTAGLVTALLDGADLPEHLRQAILDRVDGNPLFAEEIVRSLFDQNVVRPLDGGGWTLAAGAEQRLKVLAHYSDGHIEDVTRWTKYSSADPSVASVNDDGNVKMQGHGETAISVLTKSSARGSCATSW